MELMGLIHDHQIGLRSLAASHCLDAADLDRLIAIGPFVDALHDADAVDALGFERGNGLVDQAEGGNHKRHRAFPCRAHAG